MDHRRSQQYPVTAVSASGVVEVDDLTLPHTQKKYIGKNYKSAKYIVARPRNAQQSFDSGSAEPIAIPISATADSVIDLTKSFIEFKVELYNGDAKLEPSGVDAVSQLALLKTTAKI